VRFTFNSPYTDFARKSSPGIVAVFTDEAGEYIVERTDLPEQAGSLEYRLSIKRSDGQPIRTWRVLQDIKNAVAGNERYAVEIYPPESKVTDTANIYHLWVFAAGAGPIVNLLPPAKAQA
jgi:hypothetical protein